MSYLPSQSLNQHFQAYELSEHPVDIIIEVMNIGLANLDVPVYFVPSNRKDPTWLTVRKQFSKNILAWKQTLLTGVPGPIYMCTYPQIRSVRLGTHIFFDVYNYGEVAGA